MKAIRVHQPGGVESLKYEEIPIPEVQPGTVLIKNKVCGVNFIDVYHRTGLYPLPTPFVLGRDGAGYIEAVGEGVEGFKKGDPVAYTFPLTGSYAEYTVAPPKGVALIPPTVTHEQAAAAMVQGLTAHYLVTDSYHVKKGDKVLVHAAAGGAGKLVAQAAKHLGAFVIGTTSSEEKKKIALEAGCDEVILYSTQDFEAETKRITGGTGVNVVYDGVGKDTFEKSLNCLARRGFMISYGNASGKVPPFELGLLSAKGSLSINRPSLGDYIATKEEFERRSTEVFDWIAKGIVKLEVHDPLPLSEAAQAHNLLEGRKTTGKLLLLP